MLKNVSRMMDKFMQDYNALIPFSEELDKPKTKEEAEALLKSDSAKEYTENFKKLQAEANYLKQQLEIIQGKFENAAFRYRETKSEGRLTKFLRSLQVAYGNFGLIADQYKSVVNAINPYLQSLDEVVKGFYDAMEQGENIHDEFIENNDSKKSEPVKSPPVAQEQKPAPVVKMP